MITEDKVTEIICIADDFCKVFDAQMAKYSFKVGSIYSLCQFFNLSLSAECQFLRERCEHRD